MTVLVVVLLDLAPWLAFGATFLAVWLHTFEEVFGDGGPFWAYAADLAGVRAPWHVGAALFVALGAALTVIATGGFLCGSWAALSLLLGLLLGDALASHALLWWLYRRPNPGLATAPLYALLVGVVGLWLWGDRKFDRLSPAWFAAGFAAFALPWAVLLMFNRRAPRRSR